MQEELKELLGQYKDYLVKRRGRAETTAKLYSDCLSSALRRMGTLTPTPEQCYALLNELEEDRGARGRSHQRNILLALNKLSQMKGWGWKLEMPEERPVIEPERPHLTTEQAARLLAAAKTMRDRAIVLLLLDVGLRASEVSGLDVAHLNLPERIVKVWRKGSRGRGKKLQFLRISPEAAASLSDLLKVRGEAPGPVFLSKSGRRLATRDIWRVIVKLANHAGIIAEVERVSPHILRHTFSIHFIRPKEGGEKGDLSELSKILGHNDIKVTMKYLKYFDAETFDAYDQAGPRFART